MTNLPYVTAFYAALIGLLAVVLAARVIVGRGTFATPAGDGGHAVLAQRIRAHANLAEHAPLALLLLGFAEASGAPKPYVHVIGVVLVLARLSSAVGLSNSLADRLPRRMGAGLTLLSMVAASALILLRLGDVV